MWNKLRAKVILITFILFFIMPLTLWAEKKTTEKDLVAAYKGVIKHYNSSLGEALLDEIARSVIFYSSKYKIDARLVMAVITAESSFRPYVISPAGAQGLGQLMPETADSLKVDPFDPSENIEATVRYLKLNLDRFHQLPRQKQIENALAAYNAGYSTVLYYGGIPPYPETKNYVKTVINYWRIYCGLKPQW